jgi:nicotinate-nucleotide--dimethylbenzimidazole phosphoribosyltransferase
MEALAKQPDLLLLSAFGPGTGEAAAALLQGLGFGDGEARARAAVDRALAEGPADPLNLMRQLGGRETAALAGAILAARIQRTPVLLGGLTALAAAAVLSKIDHAAIAHCRAATADPYARAIGLQSVCEEDLGLTDGAEALAALMQVRLACALAA